MDINKTVLCAEGFWQTGHLRVLEGCVPGGSPDRVPYRQVVRGTDGLLRVLEGFLAHQVPKRQHQAEALMALYQNGCTKVLPWLIGTDGQFIMEYEGIFWQMRLFADGLDLPRETYGNENWRGKAAAEFILQMKQASQKASLDNSCFFLSDYVPRLMHWISHRNTALVTDLTPIVQKLSTFFGIEKTLPVTFCHGDLHPMNFVWGNNEISGVIDWEFCGLKTELYDVANLIGCIGMDSPEWLTTGFVENTVELLRRSSEYSGLSWKWLPELIVALRFGWMREWCQRKQRDMMIQELDFMWLILDNRERLFHLNP